MMDDDYDFGSLDAGPGAYINYDFGSLDAGPGAYIDVENLIPSFYTQDFAGGLEAIDLNALTDDISSILNDPEVVKALQATDPEALNILRSIQLPSDSGATGIKANTGLSEPNKGGTPLSGADLAIALGEGREVGETTGKGGFTASQEDQAEALTDPSGRKAVGANLGLSNKGGTPLSGADLAIALGEGREVGETTGEGGFTASQEDQAEALTDPSGREAVGANLGLSNKATNLGLSNKATNPLARLLSGQGGMSDLLGAGLAALMAKKAYDEGEARRKAAAGAKFESRGPVTATRSAFKGTKYSAAGGGIGSLDMAQGGRALPPRYLDGHSDGMADKVPANIDGRRPAALSDGEFVIPADVVSHLGNGNSSAGAKRLYEMMDRIRHARTGNHKQGKQINPNKFLPR